MEYMATLPDKAFDLAIVDPPYGIGIVQQMKKNVASTSSMMKLSNGITGGHWDNAIPEAAYFEELKRVSHNQIIWGGNYFLDHLGATRCFLVWDKNNGGNSMSDCELAWTSFCSRVRKFTRSHIDDHNEGITRIHPTQKPVKLYDWLLHNYAKPGQRILDTHLGSGSSAIAAHYYGVDFVGCELDKDYFNAAKNRFELATAQTSLLDYV